MSAMTAFGQPTLAEALEAEGFDLPENCRDVVLSMPTDGVIFLTYEVLITQENMAKLGRALTRFAEQK